MDRSRRALRIQHVIAVLVRQIVTIFVTELSKAWSPSQRWEIYSALDKAQPAARDGNVMPI
ncbi:MAG: hypothetical protein AAF387_01660 [Pseudomonadota bacterium]